MKITENEAEAAAQAVAIQSVETDYGKPVEAAVENVVFMRHVRGERKQPLPGLGPEQWRFLFNLSAPKLVSGSVQVAVDADTGVAMPLRAEFLPKSSIGRFGLPEAYTVRRLYFHAASGRLLVQTYCGENRELQDRILVRALDADRYELVDNPEPRVGQGNLVLASPYPFAFFLSRTKDGGNWLALHSVEIASGRVKTFVARGDLRLKTGPAEGWISQLLSIDAAEEQLNMVVAFQKKENGPVGYWLCRMNLQTREVAPVAQLLDPWC